MEVPLAEHQRGEDQAEFWRYQVLHHEAEYEVILYKSRPTRQGTWGARRLPPAFTVIVGEGGRWINGHYAGGTLRVVYPVVGARAVFLHEPDEALRKARDYIEKA